jgi:predicted  nucleic acid-binding Zn-ribbon protein
MVEADFNLMLEILKEMRTDLAEIRQDLSDIKLRVHVLEDQYASLAMSLAGINHRLDRLQTDVTVMKRRLDLVDTP